MDLGVARRVPGPRQETNDRSDVRQSLYRVTLEKFVMRLTLPEKFAAECGALLDYL